MGEKPGPTGPERMDFGMRAMQCLLGGRDAYGLPALDLESS